MLDDAKRKAYLKAMDITEWQLRDPQIVEDIETVPVLNELEIKRPKPEVNIDQPVKALESLIANGLIPLNQGSKNGLLVVLSEERKSLRPESRELISKMLKGIHFLPSETGFAVIGDKAETASETVNLESIKAILVFGNEAGRRLVRVAGARIVPGSEVFSLHNRSIVVTWHPDELINSNQNKKQAWADLKQLVQFFNND
ncbi:MAG: hypothetical protein GY829_12305 [Gammaproteobacteria bacterium]|nr:hypothetical protein [Gammaproteobacteria bacterium]